MQELWDIQGQINLTAALMTENAKDTLCRNVTIYGSCRFQDKGEECLYMK